MATPPPLTPTSTPPPPNIPPPHLLQIPSIKLETLAPESKDPLTTYLSPEPSNPPSYTITIPTCSSWFSWDAIHHTERRLLPEFFDAKSASRNPKTYKYYRDAIIRQFRENPSRKLLFTEARRGLIGDVGSIRRVFEFLETWGLINYAPSGKGFLREKREGEDGLERRDLPKRICYSCKLACSQSFFASDKADIILCTRCYVRSNYRPGFSPTDFKRVEISEETKTEWTDKETLHLLEAVLHYGEDWRKVAEHVGSRSDRECVARFVKLPFGEQFLRPEGDTEDSNGEEPCPSKRRRLTPLADASNPIMAQVAFLSAMVGSEVVEAASHAAIAALHEVDPGGDVAMEEEAFTGIGQNDAGFLKEVVAEAQSQHEKEQLDVEQSISDIVEVQMKGIQEDIARFEEVELRLEKERLQLRYMRDLLFADQLNVLQHKARLPSSQGRDGDKMRTSDSST